MFDTEVTIVDREPHIYSSTFQTAIVTCRFGDGRTRQLLEKHGGACPDPTYGHRGGVPYEALVYQAVLQPLSLSTPRFFAAKDDSATGNSTLFIEYLENATRLEFAEAGSIQRAAYWIGAFHRLNQGRVAELARTLHRYDVPYYLGWMRRTLAMAGAERPWLPELGRRYEELIGELLSGPLTVIHGEYYPKNILVRGETIAPVDWESAAIASGEIDLASLTEGWPEEDQRTCAMEYCRVRWPEARSDEFARRLAIANMYLLFRWLGDRVEWTTSEDAPQQFDCLRRLGEQLGVL